MRVRLRDYPSPEELAEMYAEPHDHRKYGYGHGLRVGMTIELGKWFAEGCESIADLSCGNGEVVYGIAIQRRQGTFVQYLGDFAPGYRFHGPIEETIERIPPVDLFVCSETLEHLEDPDAVLRQIRRKSRKLLLSTPISEVGTGNPEHLWSWGVEDMGWMLEKAKWGVAARVNLMLPDTYSYQIWACES